MVSQPAPAVESSPTATAQEQPPPGAASPEPQAAEPQAAEPPPAVPPPEQAQPQQQQQPEMPLGILDPRNRTDISNGVRLIALAGGHLLYVREWRQWIVYDGTRFRADDPGEFAKRVAHQVFSAVVQAASSGADDRKSLLAFAFDAASSRGASGMLAMARSDPRVRVDVAQLDARSRVLNVANGTIDLVTGRLLPHDPADKLTKIAPHAYDPRAACPVWSATIDKIFASRERLIGFVRRLLGSALLGDPVEDVLVIFHGFGSNGKTTLLEALLHALGDYAGKAPSSLLLASQTDRHPAEKVTLFGRRLVLCSETDEGRKINEAQVKELTGHETISARGMRQDFWLCSFPKSWPLAWLK